jgi:glutamate formiminotransferase/formiminotetrahydrofolate cyclodeaminase
VGTLCARSAVLGAFLNVRINVPGLADRKAADAYVARGQRMQDDAIRREREILDLVKL